jgi:hypothetical protein
LWSFATKSSLFSGRVDAIYVSYGLGSSRNTRCVMLLCQDQYGHRPSSQWFAIQSSNRLLIIASILARRISCDMTLCLAMYITFQTYDTNLFSRSCQPTLCLKSTWLLWLNALSTGKVRPQFCAKSSTGTFTTCKIIPTEWIRNRARILIYSTSLCAERRLRTAGTAPHSLIEFSNLAPTSPKWHTHISSPLSLLLFVRLMDFGT